MSPMGMLERVRAVGSGTLHNAGRALRAAVQTAVSRHKRTAGLAQVSEKLPPSGLRCSSRQARHRLVAHHQAFARCLSTTPSNETRTTTE